MKIYIQHEGSRRFIGPKSTWVPSAAGARDFQNSESALRFCFGHQLSMIASHSAYQENVREVVWRVTAGESITDTLEAVIPGANVPIGQES
jgi:hypothetical protein